MGHERAGGAGEGRRESGWQRKAGGQEPGADVTWSRQSRVRGAPPLIGCRLPARRLPLAPAHPHQLAPSQIAAKRAWQRRMRGQQGRAPDRRAPAALTCH